MHRGKAHSKRAFAPKEVCLPPLTPTGQMDGPSSPYQTGGPAKMFRPSPLPWPGALPLRDPSTPPLHRGKAHFKKGFYTERSVSASPRTDKTDGRGNRPLPQAAAPQSTPATAYMPVSLSKMPRQRPSALTRDSFPLQISSAPPHKGSSLSQREECAERSEPVSPRPGRADGGQTVPAKRLQQAAFFRPGTSPPLAPSHSHRTGRATRPSKGDLVPEGVSPLVLSPRQGRWAGQPSRTRRPSPQKILSGCLPSARGPLHARQEPYPAQGEGLLTGALAGTIPYRMPRAISIMLVRASSRSAEEMDCFSPFRVSEMVSRVAALLPLRAAL